MNKKFLGSMAFLLVCAAAIFITEGALVAQIAVQSSGKVSTSAGITIYSDQACKQQASSVDFGSISPGSSVTYTVYVKNTGVGVSLQLALTVSNWNPPAAAGNITVTWDKQGTVLAPGQVAAATLTLTVSSAIVDITNFSNTLTFSGTTTV